MVTGMNNDPSATASATPSATPRAGNPSGNTPTLTLTPVTSTLGFTC